VDHPGEVVAVGQEVEVEVLDVDLERERVSLSLKSPQEDPWKEFERKYKAGEIIDGQVTKLVPFGAFVRVAHGIEGLVHISELSHEHVESPEAVLSVGDTVRVKVIDVDISRRRISLSMRQVGGGAIVQPAGDEIQAEAPDEPVAGATEAGSEVAAEPEPAADFATTEAAVEAAGTAEAEPEVEAEPAAVEAPIEEQAETAAEVAAVSSRRELESIVHPEVRRAVDREIRANAGSSHVVVLESPLLIEMGQHGLCDVVVVVAASPEDAVTRLVARGMRETDARARQA